jgi:hypothetical protein
VGILGFRAAYPLAAQVARCVVIVPECDDRKEKSHNHAHDAGDAHPTLEDSICDLILFQALFFLTMSFPITQRSIGSFQTFKGNIQ